MAGTPPAAASLAPLRPLGRRRSSAVSRVETAGQPNVNTTSPNAPRQSPAAAAGGAGEAGNPGGRGESAAVGASRDERISNSVSALSQSKEIVSLRTERFFFGLTTRAAAEDALSVAGDNTMLVRQGSDAESVVLSSRIRGAFSHTRLLHEKTTNNFCLPIPVRENNRACLTSTLFVVLERCARFELRLVDKSNCRAFDVLEDPRLRVIERNRRDEQTRKEKTIQMASETHGDVPLPVTMRQNEQRGQFSGHFDTAMYKSSIAIDTDREKISQNYGSIANLYQGKRFSNAGEASSETTHVPVASDDGVLPRVSNSFLYSALAARPDNDYGTIADLPTKCDTSFVAARGVQRPGSCGNNGAPIMHEGPIDRRTSESEYGAVADDRILLSILEQRMIMLRTLHADEIAELNRQLQLTRAELEQARTERDAFSRTCVSLKDDLEKAQSREEEKTSKK